ncbi:anthranilate phosphoribosyltransferase [bacterium]|nr:anthranilate phosphoribosyltransferase [bacterium]
MIREAIKTVVDGGSLTRQQAYDVMNFIMDGEATSAQIAAFAIGEKLKGETYQEVAGFAEAMRQKATPISNPHNNAIDMCGTGGDGAGTFNVSTVASFVVAAAGVPVAKHGNRSVSSLCGSADLLEALGVKIDLDPAAVGNCLEELDIAFLFAPQLHQAMKHAVGPRREIGVRTFFNMLGPLTNPAKVQRQLLGVFHPDIVRLMAEVLRELGADHIMIIHSQDGLDEVSIEKPTRVVEVRDGEITEKHISPKDFDLPTSPLDGVLGGSPDENAQMALRVLQGEPGPTRDIVVANAACGLFVGGAVATLCDGAVLAKQALDSGAALKKLHALKDASNSVQA